MCRRKREFVSRHSWEIECVVLRIGGWAFALDVHGEGLRLVFTMVDKGSEGNFRGQLECRCAVALRRRFGQDWT